MEKFKQPLKYDGSADTFSFNESFTFKYTVPGTHTLICTLGTSSELSWNEDFTVISDSQPQAPSSDQLPSPDQFKTATLSYLSYVNQTVPGKGGPPYWCFTGDVSGGNPIPPLTVAPDGTLTGECQGAFKSGSISVRYNGTTNGQWDPLTGVVSWTMDMTIHQDSGIYSSTRPINIHDSGPIPTASAGEVSAQGSAEWSDICQSADSDHPYCAGTLASFNWSGSLDWKITFNP